jgi:hypothetical protein
MCRLKAVFCSPSTVGKLEYQQIVQLVADIIPGQAKEGKRRLTLTAVLEKRQGSAKDSERLVEMLLRCACTYILV